MSHQSEQHRTPMNDRKSPPYTPPKKKVKRGRKNDVLALQESGFHPNLSGAHKKPPPGLREV